MSQRRRFKQVVNEGIRAGLGPRGRSARFGTPTHHLGEARIPGHKVLKFTAALEDEELIRRLDVRK